MNRRYPFLRFLIRLIKGCALIAGVVGTVVWINSSGIFSVVGSPNPANDFRWETASSRILITVVQIVSVWLLAAAAWGLAELFEAIADMSETSRATAIYLRRLFDGERSTAAAPQSVNGMWDEDEPSTPVKYPALKVKTKAIGGYDRWEANDLVQIRSRQGSLKNRKTSLDS